MKENSVSYKNSTTKKYSRVKNKTKFFPEPNKYSELNTFFEKLWNINLKEKTTHYTLSYKQKQALKIIQENENIIIKEADTGNAVVILNTTYYRTRNTKR